MKKNPEISVIVPCYNVEKYLQACLESIFKQTYPDFEVICVEDASKDKTLEILKSYQKQGKVRLVRHRKNQGLAITRNDGLKVAKGKYVYFLDSDDFLSPDCLEKLRDVLVRDKSDVCCGEVSAFPEDSSVSARQCLEMNNWLKLEPLKAVKVSEQNVDYFYNGLNCLACNKLFSADFLKKHALFFIKERCFHEDNGFWLKFLSCLPVVSTCKGGGKTYFYRLRSKSISHQTRADKKESSRHARRSLQDALAYVQKNNPSFAEFVEGEIYRTESHPLFSWLWSRREKHLKILRLPIFKLKSEYNKGQFIFKLFGLVLLKGKIK